jgi:amino acid permease
MASVIGIVAASAMLVFGVVFFRLLDEDASEIGRIFIVFWMLIVILIMVYYGYNLKSRKVSLSALAEIDLDLPAGSGNIEEKLRSLERMKKDHLITDTEYLQKRKEIMTEKW